MVQSDISRVVDPAPSRTRLKNAPLLKRRCGLVLTDVGPY